MYQIAPGAFAWDISQMITKARKRAEAAARAKEIARRLELLRPGDLTERQWTIRANVSSSFFTNLRAGSEPTVGNLQSILDVVGVTLAQFFAEEVERRLVLVPTKRALKQALRDALPGLPQSEARRAEYLADTVERVLALHPSAPATAASEDGRGEAAA